MKHISLIMIYITVGLLAIWQLPWLISILAAQKTNTPMIVYSTLADKFIISTTENNGLAAVQKYTDENGNIYTQEQRDSLLPFLYWRQLTADGRMPDSIKSQHFSPTDIQRHRFTFRSTPATVNAKYPALYPLLESQSGRVDLEMPSDVFRVSGCCIEFIDMKTNKIDTAKSRKFNLEFEKYKFQFPAALIAGNPTTKKEYDEGYLMLDSGKKLFHFKMTQGSPYLHAIPLPDSVCPKHIYVTEVADHKMLALFTDTKNRFYAIEPVSYRLCKIAIPAFNPETEQMTIIANPMDWTIHVKNEVKSIYYAIKTDDYQFIRKMELPMSEKKFQGLHFTSSIDKYVKPRFN